MQLQTIKAFLLVFFLGGAAARNEPSDVDESIAYLSKSIADSQVLSSGKEGPWVYQKGVYPCQIRLNFVGSPEAELMRDRVGVFDNNAFVTLWVTVMLLEAARVEWGPHPSDNQLYLALEALQSYHDNNSPPGDGTMVFWPQSYNSSVKQWYCRPANVDLVARSMDKGFDVIHKLLDDLGLERVWNKSFEGFQNILDTAFDAFHIPPDFDDMFVNIGLGTMLSSYHPNPHPYQLWMGNNTNFTHAFQTLKKYAYRPFGDGETAVIDPRSYFYLRGFLQEVSEKREGGGAKSGFVTTWAHSISEDYLTRFSFEMPFHVNNVDLTVSANVLYGVTSALLTGMSGEDEGEERGAWFDQDLQMIYENTTDLLAWVVQRNFSNRPDVALTYYPSVYNFYWFTSRTLYALQTHKSSSPLPHPVLERVLGTLADLMRGNVTRDLLKRVQRDEDGLVYFQDFLGNADKDITGKTVKHGEDRLCSTAMAVNALLYSWMAGDKFLPTLPLEVKQVIANASRWLAQNVKTGKTYNVVFSGSVKLGADLPFFYPANLVRFLNGSSLPPGEPHAGNDVVVGVKSLIPEDIYQAELRKKHFGMVTPVDFYGYNSGTWPFWSSEPFTHAAAMLTLTRYRQLVASGQLP